MNTIQTNAANSSSPARAEASLWIVRLHGPQRSPALEAGFREWLAADPENAREFERVTEMWDVAGGLVPAGLPRLNQFSEPRRSLPLARAAAVLVACTAVAFGAYRFWGGAEPSYLTSIGEQRSVRLDDGTRVALNSMSRIQVSYSANERRVTLEAGEAIFEVARDAKRPFVVAAGDRIVTALGTSFVVRYEKNRTAVTLLDGKVSVAPLPRKTPAQTTAHTAASANDVQILNPGQRLTVATGQSTQLDTPRMDALTAWRRGEVVLDRTPLADAIAEMNRYDTTQLTIDDAQLGELRVSGVYKTGDSASFARAAARMLDLTVTEEPGQIRLQR